MEVQLPAGCRSMAAIVVADPTLSAGQTAAVLMGCARLAVQAWPAADRDRRSLPLGTLLAAASNQCERYCALHAL